MNRLPDTIAQLDNGIGPLLQRIARDVEAEAKVNVKRHQLIDTGALVNSIGIRQSGAASYDVIAGVHYAVYHEMGTRYMPARPFMGPALQTVAANLNAGGLNVAGYMFGGGGGVSLLGGGT